MPHAHARHASREASAATTPSRGAAGRRSPSAAVAPGAHGRTPIARDRAEFAATLAHELRTPLTVINGNARILQDDSGALSPDQKSQALADIRDEAERVSFLVEDLTALAVSPDAAEVAGAIEPVRVPSAVESAVRRQRRRHTNRAIEVDTTGSRRLALCVPRYVEEILDNLVTNAVKYSPPSSVVDVVVVESQDEIELHVLDRGIGIDGRHAGRLFKPFVRARKAAAMASGTGIGLVVSKRLAEAQGGRVWARPREGGGSDFGFSVRVADHFVDAAELHE
jgi:signal transduction histidine kinase